jgi:transcriptional regulator with PAS, ATPase and Fis domain
VVKQPGKPIDEALVRSRAARTLMQLFDSLYEGAVMIDRAGRIAWMNDKYKAILGWNGVEPVEGKPVEEVIPNSRMRQVVESGQADLLDVIGVGDRQVVVSRIPLTDDNGEVTGALGVILYDRLQALRPIVSKFQQMQDDLARARRELGDSRRAKYRFSQFVGVSAAVRALKAEARRAAELDATVLLLGETGTGKELLAHAIHAASPRAEAPMVRVNAAAIPETLLEAELFGTAPGAYTGAGTRSRPGKFELADRGTLFLDEIGDMPLGLQAKLLRVLQEGEVEPLGSNRVVSVDVRMIAATSRDLKAMVAAGTFRADLYYRLNVLPLVIPPLRERRDDIPVLVEALLEKQALAGGGPVRELSADALALLAGGDWPGNVRELGNVLQQAAARNDDRVLAARHFAGLVPGATAAPAGQARPTAAVRPLRRTLAEAERAAIEAALVASGGVKVQAAKLLGISRAQFYEKLSAHGLMSEEPDMRRAVWFSRRGAS